jgi:hypothetical protein
MTALQALKMSTTNKVKAKTAAIALALGVSAAKAIITSSPMLTASGVMLAGLRMEYD